MALCQQLQFCFLQKKKWDCESVPCWFCEMDLLVRNLIYPHWTTVNHHIITNSVKKMSLVLRESRFKSKTKCSDELIPNLNENQWAILPLSQKSTCPQGYSQELYLRHKAVITNMFHYTYKSNFRINDSSDWAEHGSAVPPSEM